MSQKGGLARLGGARAIPRPLEPPWPSEETSGVGPPPLPGLGQLQGLTWKLRTSQSRLCLQWGEPGLWLPATVSG